MADATGRIGWTVMGRIPRRQGYDGRLPSSWADGSRGWDGWLPFAEHPRITDPPGGRIWTAKSRVVDGEKLATVGFGGYDLGVRQRQIRDGLLAIGELAALANARLNGERVYYNVNRHINYTNLCVNRCTFCAFSREADDAGCYTLALNDILGKAAEAAAAGATELHMVGGLHPDLPFDFADLIS